MDFKNAPGSSRHSVLIACIVAAILQIALSPQVEIFSGRFNFMLALVASASIALDPAKAVWLGLFAGLVHDLTSPVPIGLMVLLLSVCAYLISNMSRGISPSLSPDALRLSLLSIFIVNLVYGIAMFMLGVETNLLVSLGAHALVSAVLDAAACTLFLLALGRGDGTMRMASSRKRPRYRGLR